MNNLNNNHVVFPKLRGGLGNFLFQISAAYSVAKRDDTSKLKSILPNFEFTSIEDGLTETINHFIENYKYIRK